MGNEAVEKMSMDLETVDTQTGGIFLERRIRNVAYLN